MDSIYLMVFKVSQVVCLKNEEKLAEVCQPIRNQDFFFSYISRKTHQDDSDKANKQQRVVCQAEQITAVEPDRCTVGLFLAQSEARTFNS